VRCLLKRLTFFHSRNRLDESDKIEAWLADAHSCQPLGAARLVSSSSFFFFFFFFFLGPNVILFVEAPICRLFPTGSTQPGLNNPRSSHRIVLLPPPSSFITRGESRVLLPLIFFLDPQLELFYARTVVQVLATRPPPLRRVSSFAPFFPTCTLISSACEPSPLFDMPGALFSGFFPPPVHRGTKI